jgi:8-amino-7-oxononanoate synthase
MRENIRRVSPSSDTPILPVLLGSNEAALGASASLLDAGFLVPAIRFPTVPRGTARLRVSVSAAHPPEAVAALAAALVDLGTFEVSDPA